MTRGSMRRRLIAAALLVAIAGFGPGIDRAARAAEPRHPTLLVAGSTTILELGRVLGAAYMAARPGTKVLIAGGGSGAGLAAVRIGGVDIGTMSRDLSNDEDMGWTRTYAVAREALVMAVNKDLPIDTLTPDVLTRLYTGAIGNWRDIGGPDLPVLLVVRPADAVAFRTFGSYVVDDGTPSSLNWDMPAGARRAPTPTDALDLIAANRGAIGFFRLAEIDPRVKALKIDGVEPTRATILSGRYPFTAALFMALYGNDNPEAQDFVDFVRGPAGQRVVEGQQYIPVH